MKGSKKDRIDGKFHEVKGELKEAVGKTVGSPKLTMEGKKENFAGKLQEKVGQTKKILGK